MIEVTISPDRITAEIPADLQIRLSNVGQGTCTRVVFTLRLPAGLVRLRGKDRIERSALAAGESFCSPLRVRATAAQSYQLTSPNFSYLDHRGQPRYVTGFTTEMSAGPGQIPATAPPAVAELLTARLPLGEGELTAGPQLTKILFLGANPPATSQLRIDQEIREIRQEIELGKARDSIQVETRWAVRDRDISRALIDIRPHFVHFAGHGGGGEESFVAEDEAGRPIVIPVAGLADLFDVFRDDVRCVLVNACSTQQLAQGLKAVLPHARVIGMRQPVGDRSAIRFSIGFYQAVGAGMSIEQAFRLGVAQMKMTPGGGDAHVPLFL